MAPGLARPLLMFEAPVEILKENTPTPFFLVDRCATPA
jgi:hypothetical protein